jgi:RNA polymerase sigma factor (sigma-70 family)
VIVQAFSSPAIASQNQISDENLVLACRRGEVEAWEVLVNRFQRLIYTIPRRAGLDEDQAAEVFQRTFAKLLENLNRIKQPGSIHAWLVTTARRETLQLFREQRDQQSLSQTENFEHGLGGETLPDDTPLPDEILEQLEEQHLLRKAMTALDERSRMLLTLLYYQQDPLSYAEIAAILNVPEGSLGPTRARCLEKLRRLLEHSGF